MKNNNFAIFGDFVYKNLAFKLKAYSQKQSKDIFKIIEKNQNKYYFLGYVKYEFYKYLFDKNYKSKEPFVYFLAFKEKEKFKNDISNYDFCPIFTKKLNKKNYFKNFKKVKNAISKGQSYQINLTDELNFKSNINSLDIFKKIYKQQNTKYKAYIKNEFLELCSFSPELFFKIKNKIIITKPMKGTIKRSSDEKQDENLKNILKNDDKNKSENVMIVDLLRNDLSKLIVKNSLKTKLFKIKTYPTLHQMISIIKGKLKDNISYYDIFNALFPCGSITGAPKIESIKLIKKLEKRQRGIYCGAIGLIHKQNAKFSVAIRTIEKRQNQDFFKYGVGSGITWQSNKKEEFKELKLKAKILKNDFYLFESMYYKDGFVLFFKEHLQRIIKSAIFFDFNLDKLQNEFLNVLNTYTKNDDLKFDDFNKFNNFIFKNKHFFYKSDFLEKNEKILRLKLYKNGNYEFILSDIIPCNNDKILISKINLKHNFLLNHKTSLRTLYKKVSNFYDKYYDIAFFDENNILCEGSRTNIIIKSNNEFITPFAKNCLNGIYRQKMIDFKLIKEKNISKDEFLKAQEIYCINSLRGLKRVCL